MNETVVKKAFIFSIILGAFIGTASLIPAIIGFSIFALALLAAPIVIIYMKKNEKHLSYLNNEQGAILGGVSGFGTTIGFFVTFSPLVCILKLIFKNFYAYMIPDLVTNALWLFFVLVFIIALTFAATNAASAMGLTWFYAHFEQKPNEDERIDIEIED